MTDRIDSLVVLEQGPVIRAGAGEPTTDDPPGSLYLRTDGDVGSSLYANGPGGVAGWGIGGGGGLALHTVRVTLATPDLATGVEIYTPTAAGDIIMLPESFIDIITPWDGTTPMAHIGPLGDILGDSIYTSNPGQLAAGSSGGAKYAYLNQLAPAPVRAVDVTPIMLSVDDGSGGPVGGTTGAFDLTLAVVRLTD